jgi:hypothetical protein
MFLKHAKTYQKLKDNDTMIALFSDSCKLLIGNPYMTGTTAARPAPLMANVLSQMSLSQGGA